ncbi:hypothetical protein QOT17_005009 [Balamuthia mandrillaris]
MHKLSTPWKTRRTLTANTQKVSECKQPGHQMEKEQLKSDKPGADVELKRGKETGLVGPPATGNYTQMHPYQHVGKEQPPGQKVEEHLENKPQQKKPAGEGAPQ